MASKAADQFEVFAVCPVPNCGYVYTEDPEHFTMRGRPDCPRCHSDRRPVTVAEAVRLRDEPAEPIDLVDALEAIDALLKVEKDRFASERQELKDTSSRETFWRSMKDAVSSRDMRVRKLEGIKALVYAEHMKTGSDAR